MMVLRLFARRERGRCYETQSDGGPRSSSHDLCVMAQRDSNVRRSGRSIWSAAQTSMFTMRRFSHVAEGS
jgi:hypothetical protein